MTLPGYDDVPGFEGLQLRDTYADSFFLNQCLYFSKGMAEYVLVTKATDHMVPYDLSHTSSTISSSSPSSSSFSSSSSLLSFASELERLYHELIDISSIAASTTTEATTEVELLYKGRSHTGRLGRKGHGNRATTHSRDVMTENRIQERGPKVASRHLRGIDAADHTITDNTRTQDSTVSHQSKEERAWTKLNQRRLRTDANDIVQSVITTQSNRSTALYNLFSKHKAVASAGDMIGRNTIGSGGIERHPKGRSSNALSSKSLQHCGFLRFHTYGVPDPEMAFGSYGAGHTLWGRGRDNYMILYDMIYYELIK